MPLEALKDGSPINLPILSIVGEEERNGVIAHVGILAAELMVTKRGARGFVYQMGPPLTTLVPDSPDEEDNFPSRQCEDSHTGKLRPMKIHAAAWLNDLTNEEMRGMRSWHRRISPKFTSCEPINPRLYSTGRELELAAAYESCYYISHPPYIEDRDPVSGAVRSYRFSCAGFVMKYYESGAVRRLISDWGLPDFPCVDRSIVISTWFSHSKGPRLTTELANACNLEGDGPWPIVMPGYVLHAFKRPSVEIRTQPYTPKEADRCVT